MYMATAECMVCFDRRSMPNSWPVSVEHKSLSAIISSACSIPCLSQTWTVLTKSKDEAKYPAPLIKMCHFQKLKGQVFAWLWDAAVLRQPVIVVNSGVLVLKCPVEGSPPKARF